MASFVEEATLILNDRASGKTAKINRELMQLHKTALMLKKSLEGINLNFKGNTAGLTAMTTKAKALERELRLLSKPVNVKVNAASLAAATTKSKTLERDMRALTKPIRLNVNDSAINSAISKVQRLKREANTPFNIRGNSIINSLGMRRNADIFGNAVGNIIGNIVQNALSKVAESATKGIMNAEDARGFGELIFNTRSKDPIKAEQGKAKLAALEFIADRDSNTGNSLLSEGDRLYNLLNQQTNLPKGEDPRKYFDGISKRMEVSAAVIAKVDQGTSDIQRETNNFERALSNIDAQGTDADSRAKQREILSAKTFAAADVRMQDFLNATQQLKGKGKGMDPIVIGDLINLREEGGRQSTADARQFIDAFTKGYFVQDKKGKFAKPVGTTAGKLNAQKNAGLRDEQGRSLVATAIGKNFIDFSLATLKPGIVAMGANLQDFNDIWMKLQQKYGLTPSEAAAPASVIYSEDRILKARKERANFEPELALQGDTLRTSMMKLDSQFQTFASDTIKPMLPGVRTVMKDVTGLMARQSRGENLSSNDLATIAMGTAALGTMSSLRALAEGPGDTPMSKAAFALNAAGLALSASAGLLAFAAYKQTGEEYKSPELQKFESATESAKSRFEESKSALARYEERIKGGQRQADDPTNSKFIAAENRIASARLEQQDAKLNLGQVSTEAERRKQAERLRMDRREEELFRRAQFQSFNSELNQGYDPATSGLTAFTASLYDSNGALKAYSDQLRAFQEKEGLKTTGKRDAATEKRAREIASEVDRLSGRTPDGKLTDADFQAMGYTGIKDFQTQNNIKADGIAGPITIATARASEALNRLASQIDGMAGKPKTNLFEDTDRRDRAPVLRPVGDSTQDSDRATRATLDPVPVKIVDPVPVNSIDMPVKDAFPEFKPLPRYDNMPTFDGLNPLNMGNMSSRQPEMNMATIREMMAAAEGVRVSLDGGVGRIEQTMSGGAQKIADAGGTAGTAIAGSIAGVGPSISNAFATGGDSAAAKIAAAVAGISVNINNNGPGPGMRPVDTGSNTLPGRFGRN